MCDRIIRETLHVLRVMRIKEEHRVDEDLAPKHAILEEQTTQLQEAL